MTNNSFICNYTQPDPIVDEAIKLLDLNGWPCMASNRVQEGSFKDRAKTIIDIVSGSTWVIYFHNLSSDNPLASLELGIALASNEVRMIAIVGTYRPNCPYLHHPKVHLFSDWDNFTCRMFVP